MNEIVTDSSTLSPLAQQLQNLINNGIVKPASPTGNVFPSAMIVLPVYDSTGSGPLPRTEAVG